MDRNEMISSQLALIVLVWKEKEAYYVNGEYDSNVALALLSNAYKIITHMLSNYTETLMRDDVRALLFKTLEE